jgi:hypothetical protein
MSQRRRYAAPKSNAFTLFKKIGILDNTERLYYTLFVKFSIDLKWLAVKRESITDLLKWLSRINLFIFERRPRHRVSGFRCQESSDLKPEH